jgi:hypothetical protein
MVSTWRTQFVKRVPLGKQNLFLVQAQLQFGDYQVPLRDWSESGLNCVPKSCDWARVWDPPQ